MYPKMANRVHIFQNFSYGRLQTSSKNPYSMKKSQVYNLSDIVWKLDMLAPQWVENMRDLYLLTGVLVGSRLVCDKQILNQSIITTIFNSMHALHMLKI